VSAHEFPDRHRRVAAGAWDKMEDVALQVFHIWLISPGSALTYVLLCSVKHVYCVDELII